jgi:hypothetical protein
MIVGLGNSRASVARSRGLGVFDSLDVGEWSYVEWALVIAAAYTVFSLASGTKRTVGRVRSSVAKRRRRKRQEQLAKR